MKGRRQTCHNCPGGSLAVWTSYLKVSGSESPSVTMTLTRAITAYLQRKICKVKILSSVLGNMCSRGKKKDVKIFSFILSHTQKLKYADFRNPTR